MPAPVVSQVGLNRERGFSMAPKEILIIEDEVDLAEMLRTNLENEGYKCRCAHDGRSALEEVGRRPPDLILLDRMLPGYSGDEVTRRLKGSARTAGIPIIMVTAKAEEVDEVIGLSLGADDYVTKPFSIKVLLARIDAIFRRAETPKTSPEVVSVGPITVDLNRYEAVVAGASVRLTVTEFKLLRALMVADGRVLDRSSLIDQVLGQGVVVTDRTIDVHVTSLRKKLGEVSAGEDASKWIQTIRGVGYTLRAPHHAAE